MSDSNRLLTTGIANDIQEISRDQRPHTEKPTKGVIMSFGFKRRTTPDKNDSTMNQNKMKDSDFMNRQESINTHKDLNNSSTNRFGFRYYPTNSRLTTNDQNDNNIINNNSLKTRGKSMVKAVKISNNGDLNRNKVIKKATTHYSQLPRPQSVFYNDPKVAKTLVNTSRKIAENYHDDCQKTRNFNNNHKQISPVNYNNEERANRAEIQINPQTNCDKRFPAADDSNKQKPSEKLFVKPSALKTYLKSKSTKNYDASPDESEWTNGGGEAMAEDVSFLVLASEKCAQTKPPPLQITTNSINNNPKPATKPKNSLPLTLEDPKFAAIAAASTDNSFLLDDETSPVESLISTSESDELLKNRKIQSPVLSPSSSASDSKDINEKSTPSPGTPTNVSSFSDGKEDFLIDDEISDQPALVFENAGVIGKNFKENEPHKQTPKSKRRTPLSLDFSLLSLRNRNSTSSLENLSSCDSLTSDDLMIDYDSNCSSGIEDNDGKSSNFNRASRSDKKINRKERAILIGNYVTETVMRSAEKQQPFHKIDQQQQQRANVLRTVCKNNQSSPNKNFIKSTVDVSTVKDDEDLPEIDVKKEEITNIKTMLLHLKHILNESEAQISLDNYASLRDNSNNLRTMPGLSQNEIEDFKLELTEMKRQILFLQGQLEDKEMNLKQLKDEMAKISSNKNITAQFINFAAQSSKIRCDEATCNAATQTDRVRLTSPNLSPVSDDNAQSLGRFQANNGNTTIRYVPSTTITTATTTHPRLEDMISYNRNMRGRLLINRK